MRTVSIIGTGTMAGAIGGVLDARGTTVHYIAHANSTATITGETVILAVMYPAIADVLAQYGDQLVDKTVVDVTNPVDLHTFDSLTVPAGSSATAIIAAQLPGSRVVKAFNTTPAATLTAKQVGPVRTSVLIAGDDTDAKSGLADLIETSGLAAIDAGALTRAHELESIGFLQLTLALRQKITWTGGFGIVR